MEPTTFDYLDNILFKSKKVEISNTFSPYILNRWMSMYSNEIAWLLNITVNNENFFRLSKEDQFKYLQNIVPKCRRKRISYLKKNKEKENRPEMDENNLNFLSENLELSKREILELNKLIKAYE